MFDHLVPGISKILCDFSEKVIFVVFLDGSRKVQFPTSLRSVHIDVQMKGGEWEGGGVGKMALNACAVSTRRNRRSWMKRQYRLIAYSNPQDAGSFI